MKIYDFPFAPNPQKVRAYVIEKGLSIPFETVDLIQGQNRTPEFLAKNPMGSLPVLELDDGSHLSESLAIIEYLEELHPEPPMIGRAPLERARVRELERLAESSILNRVARVFFNTSPVFAKQSQSRDAAEQARAGLPNAFRVMNAAIAGRLFVAGPCPTIADCTLFAAFEHAQRANVAVGSENDNLLRWYERYRQRLAERGFFGRG